jgi:hypothetical protein
MDESPADLMNTGFVVGMLLAVHFQPLPSLNIALFSEDDTA